MTRQLVCDLCCAEVDTCWNYTTPSEARTPEEAEQKNLFWCEDPDWAVCSLCHSLVQAGSLPALVENSIAVQCLIVGTSRLPLAYARRERRTVRANVIRVHTMFWERRRGAPYFEQHPTTHNK